VRTLTRNLERITPNSGYALIAILWEAKGIVINWKYTIYRHFLFHEFSAGVPDTW
jgi:hypothetical protein